MGKAKKTKAIGLKKMLKPSDPRLKENIEKAAKKAEEEKKAEERRRVVPLPASMFLSHNEALGPPYRVIFDTNMFNLSISNKLEPIQAAMDCLMAKVIPTVTQCTLAELELLGVRYRLALRMARDPRFDLLPCSHKGNYADDCLVQRATVNKCYIIATCDRDLRRRLRKIPGVPIMYIAQRKYQIERLPDGGAAGN